MWKLTWTSTLHIQVSAENQYTSFGNSSNSSPIPIRIGLLCQLKRSWVQLTDNSFLSRVLRLSAHSSQMTHHHHRVRTSTLLRLITSKLRSITATIYICNFSSGFRTITGPLSLKTTSQFGRILFVVFPLHHYYTALSFHTSDVFTLVLTPHIFLQKDKNVFFIIL